MKPALRGVLFLILLLGFQNCGSFRENPLEMASTAEKTAGASGAETPEPAPTPTPTPVTSTAPEKISLTPVAVTTGSNYPLAGLSWGESYLLSSLLLKYARERQPSVMLEFFSRVDDVLKKRDDRAGVRLRVPTWSYQSLYEASPVICTNAGMDGMVLYPISEFLVLAKEKPALFDVFNTDEIAAKQAAYRQAIEETLAYQKRKSWNSVVGTYKTNADCDEVDSQGRKMRDFDRLPFNLTAAAGRVHFNMYLATGDPAQLKIAIAVAKDLKSWFLWGAAGNLYWPYWSADPAESHPEDRSHGALVLSFIQSLAGHGVVFDDREVAGLRSTLRNHIFAQSGKVMGYIGARSDIFDVCTGSSDYYNCRELAFWLAVEPDSARTAMMKNLIHPDNGGLGKLAIELVAVNSRSRTYGESCTRDGECSTGSCYAGKVCGYKLGDSSACSLDSDCASGHCYAGRICARPLGAGSTCTRHHECVSGECGGASGSKTCL